MRPELHRLLPACAAVLSSAACLAPPPPIVVETAYGDVRASSEDTAAQVAGMLEVLAPRVRAVLPGSQERPIDVWVQDELRVYRFNTRPDSVRGFTLLSREFEARRIHLQRDGQSPWYLAHELVHALIGDSWSPLPGILEEGLADVVAQELNREQRVHIRAHRLLNASQFTGGLELVLGFRVPEVVTGRVGAGRPGVPDVRRRLVLRLSGEPLGATVTDLLETDRAELHRRWPDIPEAYYGLAWLVVSRIHERSGLEGLHALCLRATREGHALVPRDWLLEAAEIELDGFDAGFLSRCFERDEFQRAVYLRPEAFADAALEGLRPLFGSIATRELFRFARPAFVLADDSRVQLSTIGPVREAIAARWPRRRDDAPESALDDAPSASR